jgi:hypothetical protein
LSAPSRFWTGLNGTDRLILLPLVLFNGSIFLLIFKIGKDQFDMGKENKKVENIILWYFKKFDYTKSKTILLYLIFFN